jgi:uroporphyrinogen decarboxylase
MFEQSVLRDDGDQEVVQLGDGTRVRRHKTMSSIPEHVGHLLTGRASWEAHYKPRLDPDSPQRYPANWDAFDAVAGNPDRAHVLILPGGSLYGWLRNWMGVEGVSLLVYDDPALFEEIVDTIAATVATVLERVLARGGRFDACLLSEDMAYNHGPLISPAHFRRFLSKRYRRITDVLRRGGVETIIVDSDGRLDELIPLWLDAGVNTVLPFEIGTTGADPVAYRKQFGRSLRIIGGVDKRVLARSPEAVDRELDRLSPLVEDGGYIPTCDHKVPPDVPLANYRYYVDRCREKWSWQ